MTFPRILKRTVLLRVAIEDFSRAN